MGRVIVQMSIINNYQVSGCFPALNTKLLPVCFSNERQIKEFEIVNAILERRSSQYAGGRRTQSSDNDPLSLHEYVTLVTERASVDCLTLYQAANLCKEKTIEFPPSTKNFATCFIRYLLSLTDRLLVYALKPMRDTRFASNVDEDPLSNKNYSTSIPKEKKESDPLDPRFQWTSFLRDSTEFDRFYYTKDGNLHLSKWERLCPTFAVVAPKLVTDRLTKLRKRFAKGQQVFVRDDSVKAVDILLCARMIASTHVRNFDYMMNIMKPEEDERPHALFVVPKRWKIHANKELERGRNQGTRQFIPFCKSLHQVNGLGDIHDGDHPSGFFRYLQNFDWSNINACVYDPQSTKECDLTLEELPENLKVARKNNPPNNRLFVGFKLKCLAKDCQKRFRNTVLLKEHKKSDHGVNDDDMEDIRNADSHTTANYYHFKDEKEWIDNHDELKTERGCRRCPDLLELTDEIIKMHQCNVYLSNHLQRQIESLLPKSNDEQQHVAPHVARTVNELKRLHEEGQRLMIDQDEFSRYFGIWVLVLNDRTAVNRSVGGFINRQKDELLHSKLMQTYRSAADDYRDSVREAGGRDFTHLSDDSLIFRKRKTLENDTAEGYRLSLLAAKLQKRQQPSDAKTAVQLCRKRAAERFDVPTCSKFSSSSSSSSDDECKENDDDEDDQGDGNSRNAVAVPRWDSTRQVKVENVFLNSASRMKPFSPLTKNQGPVPVYQLIDDRRNPSSRNSLVLFQPEKIKVNQFDVADKIRRIICRIYSREILTECGVREMITDIVQFLDNAFKLSEEGKAFAKSAYFV